MLTLGFDTSNYTTSCAGFDGGKGVNCSQLLPVKPGQLGLRQSDALFAHIKSLPELSDRLFAAIDGRAVKAIGVSTRPRAVEGSYMPCFLAGECQARVVGAALGVPVHRFSHQQGHIAAALWSAGRMDLLKKPHLAWHLSGGTTELLRVFPEGKSIRAEKIGGTTDISAGQLIDRTGKLLGMNFPAGKAVDQAAGEELAKAFFRVKVQDRAFSFSGVQNKTEEFYRLSQNAAAAAAYALGSVVWSICRATEQALRQYPAHPVVFTGGVSANRMLRRAMADYGGIFPAPAYATDNGMGPAILAYLQEE